MVGFHNAEGGDLLIGVEDDGVITGLGGIEDNRLRYLVQAPGRVDGVVDCGVNTVELDGHRVLWFRVAPGSGEIVTTSDGRCMVRRGAKTVPASPTRIQRRREHYEGDMAFEAELVRQATLDDLDLDLLRALARQRQAGQARLGLFESDPVELLRYWSLIEGRNGSLLIRRAALLLFAKAPLRWHPNNRVRVRRVLRDDPGFGADLQTAEDERLGPIHRLLEQVLPLLTSNLRREALRERLFSTAQILPREAVLECVVNAVAHRNYAIRGQAIEILLYPGRVEFRSPGKLPEPITIKDLKAQSGVHRSRNPLIMRVLRDLGWTRDQGEGMRRIFGSMRQVELHAPELEEVADTFVVRLSTQSIYDPATQAWIYSYGPFGLEPGERRYLVALRRQGGKLSVDRLARQLNEPYDTTNAALKSLAKKGILWRRKGTRTFSVVQPFNVPHELAWRRFVNAGVQPDEQAEVDWARLLTLAQTDDPRTALALATRWIEGGILAPAGSKRWTIGASLLTYARDRQ